MDAVIRPAGPADQLFLAANDRHIPPQELEQTIRLGRILILETAGKAAGWLRWGMFWDNTPFMNLLYLLEDFRGLGHGRALVSAWEQQMRLAGHAVVMTSTQADEYAQHFYRHLGYVDVGSFALPGDPLELLMAKQL